MKRSFTFLLSTWKHRNDIAHPFSIKNSYIHALSGRIAGFGCLFVIWRHRERAHLTIENWSCWYKLGEMLPNRQGRRWNRGLLSSSAVSFHLFYSSSPPTIVIYIYSWELNPLVVARAAQRVGQAVWSETPQREGAHVVTRPRRLPATEYSAREKAE